MTQEIWAAFNKELLGFIKARVNDHETAEDILQEVFLKIHKNTESLKDTEKLSAWVYQITRHTIIDHYRKKVLHTKDYDWEKTFLNEQEEQSADFTKCLKPFIDSLPEQYKDILLKTTYEKMSQKEYAESNHLSYPATKSRIQRARRMLKDLFVKCCAAKADLYGNIISHNNELCHC